MSGRDLLTDERRLFEELCTTIWLEEGFRRVKKNKGSPGVDGVTIAEFESRLDEELRQLKVTAPASGALSRSKQMRDSKACRQ